MIRTPDMNILSFKWVFKTKLKPDGTVDKLKTRLVAKVFEQKEGIDYFETFNQVARTAMIRLVLDTTTNCEWHVKQLDVSNAFFHGELQEPIKSVPSMFVCHHNQETLVLLFYVDNKLLIGSDSSLLDQLLQALNNRFSMKDVGPPSYFSGIEFESYKNVQFLHQAAYASDILHQAGMSECNPMPTPLPKHLEKLDNTPFVEPTYFRSLAGKLQYLTITRPDL
ncbi:PREDICTED: uncharacterized protein LOC109126500 [Camelina sativa]|uniref:Uncharacterized protein LOC109126500 n=1 Tax=Camelina sativa TaxID=90675 RepID=A0ABM1QFW2_CAMSA|nr:PREDICTED: uncharacterized protein LOC109126500 [Camelina sativa]